MIKKISVFNFKVLRGLENVSLNKITLIGGRNNAGKSSLLEALFLYVGRKNTDVFNRLSTWREIAGVRIEPDSIWGPYFHNLDMSKKIVIDVTEDSDKTGLLSIEYQQEYTPSIPIPINNNGIITGSSMISGQRLHALSIRHQADGVSSFDFIGHLLAHNNSINYFIEQDVSNKIPYIFFMGSKMVLDPQNVERLSRLVKDDAQDKILPLLQRFEPKLKQFQLIKEGSLDVIYADFGNKQKIPVNFLGDGFCRCLTIALLLAADSINILLLDEVGTGIHHSMLNEFWDFLIEASNFHNCQIIATTHSYEMIQAFCEAVNEKDFNDASYIRLAKKDDIVSAYSFTFDNLYYALSSKMEVR